MSEVTEARQVIVQNNDGFMVINTLEDALKVADIIAKSSFCPKAFVGKPGDVLVCMQMGKEVGLKPLQALQNIAVINGRPSIWGDAMLAVCRQASNFDYVDETLDIDTMIATCRAKRHGEPEVVRTFSQKQAETAKLWGKEGPWRNYPERMLQMRARGFCLRDTFADVLRGIISTEEARDYPLEAVVHRTTSHHSVVNGEVVETEVPEVITIEQLEILQLKIEQSKSDEKALCSFAGIETLQQMSQAIWPQIIRKLDIKISKAQKDAELAELAKNKSGDREVDDFFQEADKVDFETGEVVK